MALDEMNTRNLYLTKDGDVKFLLLRPEKYETIIYGA
jgi:hypothetical protein